MAAPAPTATLKWLRKRRVSKTSKCQHARNRHWITFSKFQHYNKCTGKKNGCKLSHLNWTVYTVVLTVLCRSLIVSIWSASGISPGCSEHTNATVGIWYLTFSPHLPPAYFPHSQSQWQNTPIPLSLWLSFKSRCIFYCFCHACYLLPCVNWVLVASPPGSKRYKHSTVCVCCMCVCIQYHKYVHVGQPSVPLGDSAGSKLTNFCSPARLFSLSLCPLYWLPPFFIHSLTPSPSLSLSLCLLRQIVFITTLLRSQPRLQ